MTREYKVLTDEMASIFDEAMLKAGNDQAATTAAITDSTGRIVCYVFVVPACMHDDVKTAIGLHIDMYNRANKSGSN